MVVACVATFPDAEQLRRLGPEFYPRQTFGLTVGKQYLVLGLEFTVGLRGEGTGVWVRVLNDDDQAVAAPLGLFRIEDQRISDYWTAKVWEDGAFTLWPEAFCTPHFFEDLAERAQTAVSTFEKVRRAMELEHPTRRREGSRT